MISGVKAKYSNGAIVPLERLDIEEGANLSVSIEVEHHHEETTSKTDERDLNRTLDARYVEDRFKNARLGAGEPLADKPDHEMFAELRREIFGGRPVSGNSADLIREARQLRDAETEGWA